MDVYAKWNWQMHGGRIKELSAYLKERLTTLPKCTLHTPMDWDNSSGNVSFSMEYKVLEMLSSLSSSSVANPGIVVLFFNNTTI